MSEEMAIETLAKHWLTFDGYWVQTRVPFKKHRGHSDFDVVAFMPASSKVVIVECKAWGSPTDYPNFQTAARAKRIKEMCRKAHRDWKYFGRSAANKRLKLQKLYEFRLVLPGRLDDKKKQVDLEKELSLELGFKVRLFAVHEVIQEVQKQVEKDMELRRVRYPDTSLEMLRWVSRSKGRLSWPHD